MGDPLDQPEVLAVSQATAPGDHYRRVGELRTLQLLHVSLRHRGYRSCVGQGYGYHLGGGLFTRFGGEGFGAHDDEMGGIDPKGGLHEFRAAEDLVHHPQLIAGDDDVHRVGENRLVQACAEPAGDVAVGVHQAEEHQVGMVFLDQAGQCGRRFGGHQPVLGWGQVKHRACPVTAQGGERRIGTDAEIHRRHLAAQGPGLGEHLQPDRGRRSFRFLNEDPGAADGHLRSPWPVPVAR